VSLKDDIRNVKNELSTEESFLESFFKIEKFYKKYKSMILVSVVALIVATIAYYSYSYIQTQKKIEANNAFNMVLKDPADQKALDTLKENNKELYSIALMMTDKAQTSDNKFLDQLAQYTEAIKKNNVEALNSITQEQNFLLQDFALLNKAILEAKQNKYDAARSSLSMIPKDSDIQSIVKILEYFLMTK